MDDIFDDALEDLQITKNGVSYQEKGSTEIVIKHKPRKIQTDMLEFFKESVKSNKKFIMIEGPVGTGKSMAACMFMKWYKENYDVSATFDVLTNSKLLQEQYTRDFEFMNSLWGKDSYKCDTHNCGCSTGKELNAILKKECGDCPYDIAKANFFNGEVSLTNFHMFTTYKLYLPKGWQRRSRLLIIDEAHSFDEVFADFITTKISKFQLKKSNVEDHTINSLLSLANTVTDIDSYALIIKDNVLPAVAIGRSNVKRLINGGSLDGSDLQKAIEQVSYIDGLITKWEMFLTEYGENPDNWVLERNEIESVEKTGKGKSVKTKEIETIVTPVWSHPYLNKMIWSQYDHVVFMSGTILNKEMFAWMNGLDLDLSSFISVPSPFPIENRPIYYIKCGKMNFKDKVTTFENMIPTLKNIMQRHINDKGIVHCVNYELTKWVQNALSDNRLLLHESHNRQEVLDFHINTTRPTVLCSPSMMTGIDLKEDLSRFQLVLKMPYPNMKSEKIKKRMETYPNWYSWKTICELVQMCGRSVRSETDTADTYILDSCLSDIMRYSSHLLPGYFRESIITVQ